MVENGVVAIGKKRLLSPHVPESKTSRRSLVKRAKHVKEFRFQELIKKFSEDLEGYPTMADHGCSEDSDSSEDEGFDCDIFASAKELAMRTYIPIYKKYVDDNLKYYRNEFREHVRQYMPKRYRTFDNSPTFPDPLIPHRLRRSDTVCVPESPNCDMFPCLVKWFPSSVMLPRMRYYIHVDRNIQTDDTYRLSNFPQLESNIGSVEFHSELRKAYPEGIHGERRGWGLPITDELLYHLVNQVLSEWTARDLSTSYVFKAIHKLFPTKLVAGELEDLYSILARKYGSKPTFKKLTKSVVEVDHSISSLYCGKCNQFFCELHALDGTDKVAINRDCADSDVEETEECGPDCYKLVTDDEKKEGTDVQNEYDKSSTEESTLMMLKLFLSLDKLSSCCLSKVISNYDSKRNWKCREVFAISEFMKREKTSLSPEESKERKKLLKDLPTGHKSLARMTNGEINNSAKLKPCSHEGACTDCICSQENTPCTKFCKCNEDCRRKLRGCICLPGQCGTNLCPCYLAKWECDSDNCRSCICGSSKFDLSNIVFQPTPDPDLNYYGDSDFEEECESTETNKPQNSKMMTLLGNPDSFVRSDSAPGQSMSRKDLLMEIDQCSDHIAPQLVSNKENRPASSAVQMAAPSSLESVENRQRSSKLSSRGRNHAAVPTCRIGENHKKDSFTNAYREEQFGDLDNSTEEKNTSLHDVDEELPNFFNVELNDESVEGWIKTLNAHEDNSKSMRKTKRMTTIKNEERQTDVRLRRRKKFRFLDVRAYKKKQDKVLKTVFGNDLFDGPRGDDTNKQEGERCNNCRIQNGQFKHLKVGVSAVAGYGCFLGEPALKGDLIAEYTGEVISRWEAERRGLIYDEFKCSFIFALNNSQSVDATRMGNTIRFANHSDNGNCYSQIIVVNGEHRIGIFAKTDLPSGEEIFFDYQYNKNCKEKYVPKGSKDL